MRLHVAEDAPVNPVHQRVRPDAPVRLRPHSIAVPARTANERPAAGERDEVEAAALGAEEAVEVGRVEAGPRRELAHRRRLRANGELEPASGLPDSDRL